MSTGYETMNYELWTMDYNKVLALICFGTLLALCACKRETKDERFRREFQQFTQKECPKLIDENTRMDSICYDIDIRTLSEYYTVMNELDVDAIYADGQLMSTFRESMLKGLKGSLPMKAYKDESITFRYVYRSASTGKTRLELTFTPEDYE